MYRLDVAWISNEIEENLEDRGSYELFSHLTAEQADEYMLQLENEFDLDFQVTDGWGGKIIKVSKK